jgi:hypothetical protein
LAPLMINTIRDENTNQYLKEGSQARLPAPSPRGTERDGFPSLGSSSTKASICTSLTRELGVLPERPSRYSPAAAVHVARQCWGRTHQCCSVHLLSPHTNGSTNFFAKYHQSDAGPLSCQVTLKPVSAPLQRGIRFFRYPTPASPWAEPYGLLSSKKSDTGFPRSMPRSNIGLGVGFRPGCMWVTKHIVARCASLILLVQAR